MDLIGPDLIGRDRELADVVERLESHRLVTVIGPGGIGKTSVARATAARPWPGLHGRGFVDLTRVDTPDAVAGAIAAQLGFPSFSALVSSPTDQPVLLVVDNCEHVIDAAASAVADLLASCEAPRVLATSRSPLDLPGESVVVLGPLGLPNRYVPDGDAAAVRLFFARARDAGARLGDDQIDAVAELCRALDGVPLSLELAAARTRVMTPAEILGRLADLDTLHRARFRGVERHRSLRATIEWSYRQLSAADRATFDRLGVLAGTFDLETAHAVAGTEQAVAVTLAHLDTLVSDSLLVSEQTAHGTSYRQLETIRTFALERLRERGEHDVTWERFVDHVTRTAVRVATDGRRGWDASVLTRLLGMYDNVRAALRWCLDHDTRPRRALVLVSVLWGVMHQGGAEDIGALGEEVLARWDDPSEPGWADAAATVATCRHLLGAPEEAIALAERALDLGGPAVMAPCTLHRVIGQARRALGDMTGAIVHFDAAAEAARARDLAPYAQESRVFRVQIDADLGRVDEALAELRAVQDEARVSGSDINWIWARSTEGYVLLRRDADAAIPIILDALDASRRADYPAGVVFNLLTRSMAEILRGERRAAAGRLAEALDEIVGRGSLSEMRSVLLALAVLVRDAGRAAWTDLVATARHLPVVSIIASPGYELFPLPDAPGKVLTMREAVLAARAELAALLAEPSPSAAQEAPPAEEAPEPDASSGSVRSEASIVRAGDVFEVTFAGRSVAVRASKGMEDLIALLATPERDVHCLDLAGAGVRESDLGETLDAAARRRLEDRLRELQGEIDEASSFGNHARLERAQTEFDAIVDHLTAALGLDGRARRTGGTAERARSTVTQRVRGAIRRLGEVHPELGRHLEASVRTGVYCSYRPEHPVRWRV